MTDVEKRVRRLGPLKLAIVALAIVGLVIPVMAVMAASPDPTVTTPASSAAASPKASATNGVKSDGAPKPDKGNGLRDRLKAFGGFGGGIARGLGGVTITAIDGSKLSLKTADGWTRTITVTTDTTITKGGQAIKVGDLDVGDKHRLPPEAQRRRVVQHHGHRRAHPEGRRPGHGRDGIEPHDQGPRRHDADHHPQRRDRV